MIEDIVAYFEKNTALSLPLQPRLRFCCYDFTAKTAELPFLAFLYVSIYGPQRREATHISFTFGEGYGERSRFAWKNRDPYFAWLEGDITRDSVTTRLLVNGSKWLENGGVELNPNSVFANIRSLPFKPSLAGNKGEPLITSGYQ